MRRIGPPGVQRDKSVSVQLEFTAFKRFGNTEPIGNLAREKSAPKIVKDRRRCLLAHRIDDLGDRDCLCAGETLEERSDAEAVIAMSVRDVDRGEILAARSNPIDECL
jgi:hypothetical protein